MNVKVIDQYLDEKSAAYEFGSITGAILVTNTYYLWIKLVGYVCVNFTPESPSYSLYGLFYSSSWGMGTVQVVTEWGGGILPPLLFSVDRTCWISFVDLYSWII